jgi:15-cis-phytoene synthase
MVNAAVTMMDEPLRDLASSYAPRDRRAGLAALFALDAALGDVLRSTRQPMVGQIRLAWWREALERLDAAPPPGEPVLTAVAADVITQGVTGASLAPMTEGWEVLLAEPTDVMLSRYAERRGAILFGAAATLLGVEGFDVAAAGQGWALADLAGNLGDGDLAGRARALALPLLEAAVRRRWPRRARSLGALVYIARWRLDGTVRPASVLRLGWHRLTGR